MKHFNRFDLAYHYGNEIDEIDERYQITEDSMNDCDIVVDYRHNDADKVVYDMASCELYYDDDLEFVGVFILDGDDEDDDCQDVEYFCFKRKKKEK